jgi:hypothetical protein
VHISAAALQKVGIIRGKRHGVSHVTSLYGLHTVGNFGAARVFWTSSKFLSATAIAARPMQARAGKQGCGCSAALFSGFAKHRYLRPVEAAQALSYGGRDTQ